MTSTFNINPLLTTNAAGSFNISSSGFIQGIALDDPSARNYLSGGVLNSSETLPMWGGVAISETVSPVSTNIASTSNSSLGGYITRATTISTSGGAGSITGWSVFNQAHSMITSPQSPVPLAPSGGMVNFYRLGSNARIAVAADPALVSQEGVITTAQLSWDFVNQRLIPFSGAYPQTTITGAVWANTAGGQTTFTVGTDLTSFINTGDDINVSGVVNTGGTSTSAFNGPFTVVSVTSTTIVVTQVASASPGTYASGGVVLAGGGIVPVRLLDVQVGNSMTVVYNTSTGFATYNRQGTVAIILV